MFDRKSVVGLALCVALIGGAIVALKMLPPTQQQPEAKKDEAKIAKAETPIKIETKSDWPEKARFAVVSNDGRTVAFMKERTIIVVRDGKELSRNTKINMLHPEMRLSPDGSTLAVICIWQEKLLLLDTETGKLRRAIPDQHGNGKFTFTPSGDQIVLDPDGKEPKRFDTLADVRRVRTTAVCSDDGMTVAIQGAELQLIKEGKLLSKINRSLSSVELSRNGSRLLGYDDDRKVTVLLDTADTRELKTFEATGKTVFHFSPGGGVFGIAEPGATEMLAFNSWDGSQYVKIPARQDFRVSGRTESISYKIADFGWSQVESTDSDLAVSITALPEKEGGYRHHFQWGQTEAGYWRNVDRIYACLDQVYEFNPDGTLTKHAGK